MLFVFLHLESEKIAKEKVTGWTSTQSADCAVVLTGARGRVREGIDLLSQKRIKKLILSGVYSGASLREIFPQWPYYGDLNEGDVILEKRSRTTYGNAQQTLVLTEALHCSSLIIITSRLHMYRARKIFNKLYPENIRLSYRAILSTSYVPDFWGLYEESFKSLFYRIWAY